MIWMGLGPWGEFSGSQHTLIRGSSVCVPGYTSGINRVQGCIAGSQHCPNCSLSQFRPFLPGSSFHSLSAVNASIQLAACAQREAGKQGERYFGEIAPESGPSCTEGRAMWTRPILSRFQGNKGPSPSWLQVSRCSSYLAKKCTGGTLS